MRGISRTIMFVTFIRPQQGRQRQFHQIGVESLGDPHPYCDVTHLSLAAQLLKTWKLLKSSTVFG